ncbi:histamine N-methyltransferase-like isoform X1 [Scyliorhinus torazame]|uniref:histamine N-methyltransferase-like isoform X1 n=1 Tax=Scyliorhinus torazame TaxID=75743 RepID=UPI003B5CDC27
MESSMKSLSSDFALYCKSLEVACEQSNEHQCLKRFIDETLPHVIARIGKNGGSSLEVLGIGSGSGEIDIEILGKIQLQHPGLSIHNEVVEPNPKQISKYKALVEEKCSGLNISFRWNQMSSEEYERQNKEKNESKKFDFIHMIEMLYYVESVPDTLKYFHSLLETNGKLLITQTADEGGYHSLWKKFGSRFVSSCRFFDVPKVLDAIRKKYQIYKLSSDMDITECFIEGNKNGERLLNFLTDTVDFRKNAPANLRDEVLHYLRHPQCSREENGKIIFNNDLCCMVVDY